MTDPSIYERRPLLHAFQPAHRTATRWFAAMVGFLVLLLLGALAVDTAATSLAQRQLRDSLTAATNDAVTNREVFEDGEAAGVWVNSADDPASCAFTLPSVTRRGPIMVTISTGGHSPALASWLRAHVDDQLGPEYEVLVGLLSRARDDLRASGRSTEGVDWRMALDSDMLDLIRAGHLERAKERLQACLSSSSD